MSREYFHLVHTTNIRGAGKMDVAIGQFYSAMKVPHSIVVAGGKEWKEQNRHLFDYYLGTAWDKHNGGDEESWEIEPFPPFNGPLLKHDIVISPIAGWDISRSFSLPRLAELAEQAKSDGREITYVGHAPPEYADEIRKLPGNSRLNGTTMSSLIDIVVSCKTVIANQGFIAFLGCAAGRQVFSIGTHRCNIREGFHPEWNVKCLPKLEAVQL